MGRRKSPKSWEEREREHAEFIEKAKKEGRYIDDDLQEERFKELLDRAAKPKK